MFYAFLVLHGIHLIRKQRNVTLGLKTLQGLKAHIVICYDFS